MGGYIDEAKPRDRWIRLLAGREERCNSTERGADQEGGSSERRHDVSNVLGIVIDLISRAFGDPIALAMSSEIQ
jgi:hypothetical protein